jgi:hypothetical protein
MMTGRGRERQREGEVQGERGRERGSDYPKPLCYLLRSNNRAGPCLMG